MNSMKKMNNSINISSKSNSRVIRNINRLLRGCKHLQINSSWRKKSNSTRRESWRFSRLL